MLVNGIIVHHQSNVYRLYLRDGTGLAEIRFPNSGDTDDESRIIKIFIKHLKGIWRIN